MISLTSGLLRRFTSWETNSELFFGTMVDEETMDRLKLSFTVNIYRSPSFGDYISLSKKSLCANLIHCYCPLVQSNLVNK